MRRVKSKKQSKFMQIVTASIKVLSKARDLYMMGMKDCSAKMSSSGVVVCPMVQVAHLHNTCSFKYSFKASDNDDGEELVRRKLIAIAGAASSRNYINVESKVMVRSYSVGVGKIGRIDEDKPCAFEEEGFNTNLMHPRTTTSLKRNFVLE